MRYLILFMLVFAFFMFFKNGSGCGSFGGESGKGPVKSETRELSAFKKLEVNLSGSVKVLPSETFRVEVSAQENLLPIIKTEVKDDLLTIYFSKNVWSSRDMNITVYVPSLERAVLGGSGNIEIEAPVTGSPVGMVVAGSGQIAAKNVNAGTVVAEISGSGGLVLQGKAADLEANISGSGHVDAEKLSVLRAKTDVSGSGSVTCDVAEKLEANISGSGNVQYRGEASVNSNVSGSGSVVKL